MANRFFHREFLAQPDDDSTAASVIARVGQSNSDYLAANVAFSDGYDHINLHFHAWNEEDVDEMERRVGVIADIMNNFRKALQQEAKDVRKAIKARPKEDT